MPRQSSRTLHWRHNGSDDVSNQQPHDCLLNGLFKAQIGENIKAPRHWPLCGEFTGDRWIPRKRPVPRKMFSFDDVIMGQQGKSEGFESCDQPTVRKCPIWVKIGDVLYRVTLKFDGWTWKTIGHLSFAVSSFVQHFIAIGEFKLELQSGNTQFGSNLMIFRAVWPWNLTDDLQKQ